MAKFNLDAEITAAIAAGAVAQPDNKFLNADGTPLRVRSMENISDPLQEGDILLIPETYKVLLVKFKDDDEQAHPCIFCTVKSTDDSERSFRFFPNSLCKSITPYADGHRGPKVKTTGTASDLYRTVDTIDEGLALIKGKSIKVTKCETYSIKEYKTGTIRDTHIYRYDLVA